VISYIDWVQTVVRACLAERPTGQLLTVWKLAEEVGLPTGGLSDEERNPIILGLDHVLRDLAPQGFVNYDSGGHTIEYPPSARRFRTEPLTATWGELRSGYLDPDDETFLAALASLSEQPGEDRADVQEVDARDVFASLGWEWDGNRAYTIYGNLKGRFFVEGRVYAGPAIYARVTYAGLVRALDEAGSLLREAEDHLHVGRLRAAGCVAAVELERRLKLIAPTPTVKRRDPGLEDYNQAAFDAGVIDQETWTLVRRLAAIRKRCVHVLDREPTSEEVRDLIDGLENVLRAYPAPG
jgi:hypothetical protein